MTITIISDNHNIHSILLSEDHFFVEHKIHSIVQITGKNVITHAATYALTSECYCMALLYHMLSLTLIVLKISEHLIPVD